MAYYTFHIDDSGAIEDVNEENINGENIPVCILYDDEEFNKLNDIIHSLSDYILNEKALKIFKEFNTIPYELRKAKVLRKEKVLGFFKKYKSYNYYELSFPDEKAMNCYEWIDFKKSEIFAIDSFQKQIKITSHQQELDMIIENKSSSEITYSFKTKKVVFGKKFDSEIDLFKIPHYSWGTYISKRLKNKLEEAKITDIGFAESKEELGKMWKPHFPIIEFSK